MKVIAHERVDAAPVTMEGAAGCTVRWLIGKPDDAPNFAMREFEVQPGGHTPKHFHPYEHEIFILAGEGVAMEGNVEHPLKAGDVIYVAPNDVHQFRNTGTAPLKFLCLVPNSSYSLPVQMAAECAEPASR